MPTVPRMTGQRVSTAPLPGVRVGGAQPTPGLDLSGVTRLAAGIYQAERQKADEVAFLDADNHLATIETDLRGLAAQKRGKDAIGATAEVEAEWQKRTSEVEASLSNDRQKAAYRRRVGARWQGLYAAVERHASGESRQYEDDTYKGALANRVRMATENWQDREQVDHALAESVAVVLEYARHTGMSSEAKEATLRETVSTLHANVIAAMVNKDDRAAEQYYGEVKADVHGRDKDAVEQALGQGTLLGESQREADRIRAIPGITRTQAYDEAKKLEPKLRKAVTDELRGQYGNEDNADNADESTRLETALTYAYKGQLPPPTLFAALRTGNADNVRRIAFNVRRGEPIETDWATYVWLKETAVKDPVAFKQLNPNEYRSKLGDTEFKQFVDWHTARKAGRESDDLRGGLTVTQQIGLALKQTDLSSKPEDDEQVVRFKVAAHQRVADWQQEHDGKTVPIPELQKITDQMVRDQVYLRSFGGGTRSVPAFGKTSLDPDQRKRSFVPYKEIPVEEIDALKELFRARGKRSNTALIERAYAADRLGDYALMQSIIQGAP